jgi:hypothetical protein
MAQVQRGIRARTVIYGIGRWTSGNCQDGQTQFSDVGVNVPQTGQIGNLTVDAHGTGTAPDDGTIGLNSTASGQLEVEILHADGTRNVTPLTCSLGVSSVDAKVHCEDKTHHVDVVAGDQVVAQFWFNPRRLLPRDPRQHRVRHTYVLTKEIFKVKFSPWKIPPYFPRVVF